MRSAPRLALPLSLGLAFSGGHAAHAIDDFFPGFGNDGYDVQRYDLALRIDADEHRIEDGRAVLTIRATTDLTAFALDLSGLEVTRVLVDGAAALFTRDEGKLRVRLAKRIAKGARFTVEVGYRGKPAAIDDPTSSDPDLLKLGWLNWNQTS